MPWTCLAMCRPQERNLPSLIELVTLQSAMQEFVKSKFNADKFVGVFQSQVTTGWDACWGRKAGRRCWPLAWHG